MTYILQSSDFALFLKTSWLVKIIHGIMDQDDTVIDLIKYM